MFEIPAFMLAQQGGPAAPRIGGGNQTATPQQNQGTTTTATTGQSANPDNVPATQPTSPLSGLMTWLPLIAILVIFWLLIFGGQRKEKKKRAEMLSALKKNDRIQTIGGIIGTVIEVRENDIILKIDEATNTRMRVSRGAVQQILSNEKVG